ncbi:MAG: hypothetical protein M1833_003994 [Piccolia ochrophora]|nr:MAG: hypothetical protein M1833_003994 [Piccolia ochrophora]
MCWWQLPRAAVIRDTLYLDGGYIGYLPGFADGSSGAPEQPQDEEFLYSINFTQPFRTSQNASDIFRRVDKTAGAANNLAPNYIDGAMFANDNEFYLYGGLLRDTDSLRPPPATSVLGYERYQYGPERASWDPGFYNGELPEGVSRYITAGAAVNIPSENLGFYFSGMKRKDGGDIRTSGRQQYNATAVSDSLIAIDMATMREENWSNDTLPDDIPGRANGELVWIPSSDRGLLVAIGGVINPEWAYRLPSEALTSKSEDESPGFMKTVSVYDIRSKKWYKQETSGDTPPQLTRFCSVVATAEDSSSHNIYIYGGYDGLDELNPPSDDVYILSLPSFTWVKAKEGTKEHGRREHRCTRVYPDQMLVVGGQALQLDDFTCLDGGLIQIFNLNTLEWQEEYDPSVWEEYKVPDVVTAKIGGNAEGGATSLEPSSWDDDALGPLFTRKYTKTITNHYPYASVSASPTDIANPTRISTAIPVPSSRSSVPSWVAPVLGTVLGLVFVCTLLSCFVLWRRRKYLRRFPDASEAGSSSFNRHRVMTWVQGTPPTKAPTVTSDDQPASESANTAVASQSTEEPKLTEVQELPAPLIHEMPDTSTVTELPPESMHGFAPIAAVHASKQRSRKPSTSPHASPDRGIPRPESPTTDYVPGHTRNVSSLDTNDVPGSPTSNVTADIEEEHEDDDSDDSTMAGSEVDAAEGQSVLSPVSPEDGIHSFAALSPPGHGGAENRTTGAADGRTRRQSSFGELLD